MTVLSIAEKKNQILVIIGDVTRANLTSAFGNNLTPVIEQMLQLTPGADPDFAPFMNKAWPRIGIAMTEIFDHEFMAAVVGPTIEGYSDEEVENIYLIVTNPMYGKFVSDVTVGMVQSPAYMQAVMSVGTKVEEILASVWQELHPPKTAEEQMREAADALLQSPAVDHLPQ